ncbi:MAG: hypothetical protein M3431_09925 [Actinomycetota bacterium]|nr:hypothetical protein [Actinomycetota bacterium]
MNDDELYERLEGGLRQTPPPVDPARVARVRALAEQAAAARSSDRPALLAPPVASVAELHPRRSMLLAVAAGVVGVVAGGAAVAVTRNDDDGPDLPLEAIALDGVPVGVIASASVVDHTWGMELLLDVEGLSVGERFEVVYVSKGGERVGVGGFVGAGVPIRCRNTSPLMRADAAKVEVIDATGAVVMSSMLV